MPEPILSAVIPNAMLQAGASDTILLPEATVGVRVTTGGVLALELWGNRGEIVLRTAGNGEYITGQIRRIMATGTTAAGFVVDYIAH